MLEGFDRFVSSCDLHCDCVSSIETSSTFDELNTEFRMLCTDTHQ